MKKSIPIFVLTAFMAGSILTSCNTSTSKVEQAKMEMEETSKKLDQAMDHYEVDLKKFKTESDKRIAANKKTILALKEKSKSIEATAKTQFDSSIDVLEEKNQLLNKKMENYSDFSSDKWESFKIEFNQDMDELGQALKDLSNNNVM